MKSFIREAVPAILLGCIFGLMIVYMIMNTCGWQNNCY